jgi:ACS family tartrate transporter-like MFS transporter
VDTSVPNSRHIEPIERETIRRVAWRLMPLLALGYFCAYLDRANVGMAATTMTKDLGFSNTVFGFGAGLFFLGYFLAEVPSNLLLNKLGARRWISRILITWGIISGLTAFVWNDLSFYGIRFFLGLAEAGFYPGVVLYLTWWFPSAYRTRMMALFQSAQTISLIIGPPVGGLLLHMQGVLGLTGWQWLFIIEALPPVVMCVVTWRLLTDRPKDADWLRPDQKAWLVERLDSERVQREAIRKFSLAQAFYNPKVLLISLAYIGTNSISYVLVFFLPLIVKGLGVTVNYIGVVSAYPTCSLSWR